MGKGGFFLTFVTFVVLLGAGWYVLGPDGSKSSGPPNDPPALPGVMDPPAVLTPYDRPATLPVSVGGLVYDRRTGRPIEGARIHYPPEDQDPDRKMPATQDAVTDAAGEWNATFRVVPSSERVKATARVTAEGYLPWRLSIRVSPGDTRIRTSPVRLFPAGARVSGRVFTAEGIPVPGARVGDSVSDGDGRYGPILVAGGRITLTAIKEGHPEGTARKNLEPGPLRDTELDIYLPVSTPYSGLVTDLDGRPLTGASVRLGNRAVRVTREDGAFSFPGVNGDNAILSVTKDGWRPASVRGFAGRPLTVRLPQGGVLTGLLRHADGSPVGEGYTVGLRGRFEAGDLLSTHTDETGRFRMTLPAGGPVEIEVWAEAGECGAFVVEVMKGDTLDREFTLDAARSFPVRVVSAETGESVAGAVIAGGWPVRGLRDTDDDGIAAVPFPPVRVAISKTFCVVTHPGFLPEDVLLDGAALSTGEPCVVRLLSRGMIRARVLDPVDRPIAGVLVQVHVTDPPRTYQSYSGADGRAEIDAPAGRLVAVSAVVPNVGSALTNATAPASVTLRPANPDTPDVRRIRVLAAEDRPVEGAWVEGHNRRRYRVGKDGRVAIPGTIDWVYVMAPGHATRVLDLESMDAKEETVARLSPGRDVAVLVADAAGGPVQGARVFVTAEPGVPVYVPNVTTGSDGKATLPGLPEGIAVMVGAKLHGFSEGRAWLPANAREVGVRLARWGEVHIRLGGTGLRAGQPISWRWRTIDRAPFDEEAGESGARRVPDDSRVVRITVPTGRLALLVECAGAAPRIFPEVVVAENQPGQVTYTFPRSGGIRVIVRDENDNYIEGARLFVPGINWHFAWTTARGRIPDEKRRRIPGGKMRLVIAAQGYATVWTAPIDFASTKDRTIVLPRGLPVEGRLVTADGSPVPGRIRVLTHVDQPDRTDQAGADGRFRISRRLAEGEHRVWIQGRGFPPVLRTISVAAGAKNEVELAVE